MNDRCLRPTDLRGVRREARFGSRPCENSRTFSHGPISFAFSSPETVQRRRNHGNLRSPRPVAKFCGVLTRPRSAPPVRGSAVVSPGATPPQARRMISVSQKLTNLTSSERFQWLQTQSGEPHPRRGRVGSSLRRSAMVPLGSITMNGVQSLKGGLRAPLSWTRTPLRSECSFGGVPRGARSS